MSFSCQVRFAVIGCNIFGSLIWTFVHFAVPGSNTLRLSLPADWCNVSFSSVAFDTFEFTASWLLLPHLKQGVYDGLMISICMQCCFSGFDGF